MDRWERERKTNSFCCIKQTHNMKQAIYTIGKEDFSIWEKTNKNIEHIIITGSTDFDGMEKFVKEFDYTKFHYITIEDVLVEDEVSTEGHHHTFVEEVKFAKTYADDPITPFEKMYVNTDVAKNFIVIGKDVFSFDKKTLIHLDEVSTELQLNAETSSRCIRVYILTKFPQNYS